MDFFVSSVTNPRGDLKAAMNYVRFYFDLLLPGVDIVLYLDADTLVLQDVSETKFSLTLS